MPSLSSLARRFADRAFGTVFERVLDRAAADPRAEYLFFWNRGLGDIALGLVPLFARVRERRPDARIVVVTREELRVPFAMTGADEVHALRGLEREARVDLMTMCRALRLDPRRFAATFEYPDPNRWLEGRRLAHPPRLAWVPAWDALAQPLLPADSSIAYIGAHVCSETARYYGYRKDWPAERWQALFRRFDQPHLRFVLLGYDRGDAYQGTNLVDLRGRTDFPALMALVRHRLAVLLAPDSGVLTMAYYIDEPFALHLVSLWADPRQGVLRQGCDSPNRRLAHTPLVAPGEDLGNLDVEVVEAALRRALAARGD
jgi:ADP-heptose:LPS heptosyltransferase